MTLRTAAPEMAAKPDLRSLAPEMAAFADEIRALFEGARVTYVRVGEQEHGRRGSEGVVAVRRPDEEKPKEAKANRKNVARSGSLVEEA